MGLDKDIFACFSSPTYRDGKKRLMGIVEAERAKKAAVLRGFAPKPGEARKNLSSLEQLVILMRGATSGEEFNHEWWAAEISKPGWVQKLDTDFSGGWLHFPTRKSDLTAKRVGERIGYQLALTERKLGRMVRERAYRQRVEAAELERAKRGIDLKDRKKVRIAIPGYANLKDQAQDGYQNVAMVRQLVLALAGEFREREALEFLRGQADGALRAYEVELEDELSQYNEREEVVTILKESWWQIDRMRTRREITDYVFEHLPDSRRKFFKKNPTQHARFVDRLRQTFYEPLGLRPAGRGRPVKLVRR